MKKTKFITLFFKSLYSSFQNRKIEGLARGSVESVGGGCCVVMPTSKRPRETLQQVRSRLSREQAERTRKRIEELAVESKQETGEQELAEQDSEVRHLVRQSRQLLREVEEERKVTVRVSLSCCYCTVCCVVCIVLCLCSVVVFLLGRQHTTNGTEQH